MDLQLLDPNELKELKSKLEIRYKDFQSKNLTLDMTRGKPCPEQLDLSLGMLSCVNENNYKTDDGVDCRNYGGLDGIPEAKRLFSEYMDVTPDELIIGGNSSLKMMHDTIIALMINGPGNQGTPWAKLPKIKFLCPSPGYDRHFFICDYLNIEMLTIDLNSQGPDMDRVEEIVAEDDTVKGMWCVPKYSNPTGICYSDSVVERLANMKTKSQDFRILWDNAYAVHHLNGSPEKIKNILTACKEAGCPERVFMFGSTSKISFAGSGIAMMAGSRKNMEFIKKQMSFQTIGPDKLNQLQHVAFFKDLGGILELMQKHADILKPKFDVVLSILEKEIGDMNIANWSRPSGGYFVSLDTMDDCAEAVVKLASEGGVKLTPAGSTYPYKKDPQNRNIRIAPSFPPVEDIEPAMELLGICIQLVSISKIMGEK